MPSTHRLVPHLNIFRGMSRAVPPHVIPDGSHYTVRDFMYREEGMVQTPIVQRFLTFNFTGSLDAKTTGLLTFGQQPYYVGMSLDRASVIDPVNTSSVRQIYCYNKTTTLTGLTTDAAKAQCLVTGFEELDHSTVTTVEVNWASGSATYNIKINGTNAGGPYTPTTTGTAGTGAALGLVVYHKDTGTHGNDRSWLYTRSLDMNHPNGGSLSGFKWKYWIAGDYLYATNGNYVVKAKNETYAKMVFNTAGFCSVLGRYLAVFYNHLVVGQFGIPGEADAPASNRMRVGWSHLEDLDAFAPTTANEADDYIIPSVQAFSGASVGHSVTGVEKLGDRCYVYTPSGIHEMNYKGLPEVMIILEKIPGEGNLFHDAVVNVDGRFHAFIGHDNIFAFDGSNITPIGNDIAKYFYDNVAITSDGDESSVYGFYDKRANDLLWRFIDNSGNHQEMRYSLSNQAWTVRDLPNIFTTFDDFYAATGRDSSDAHLLYGGSSSHIFQDVEPTATPDLALVQKMPSPMIETADFIHADPNMPKEIDCIYVDTSWSNCGGVQVDFSARERTTEDPTFVTQPEKWQPTLPEKRLSFPRTRGKLFRYRLTWTQDSLGIVQKVKLGAYGEYVYGPWEGVEK